MPEQKLPLAGEWWIDCDDDLVYVVGHDTDGDPVFMKHDGNIADVCSMAFFVNTHRHVPECTGWDWKPEPKPKQPKRVPVRLWMNDDGDVFRSFIKLNAMDQEIFHDENGFYTMEEN